MRTPCLIAVSTAMPAGDETGELLELSFLVVAVMAIEEAMGAQPAGLSKGGDCAVAHAISRAQPGHPGRIVPRQVAPSDGAAVVERPAQRGSSSFSQMESSFSILFG